MKVHKFGLIIERNHDEQEGKSSFSVASNNNEVDYP